MEKKFKNGLLIFFCVVLLLPILQRSLSFVHSGKLYGAYVQAPEVQLTLASWFDGSYQTGMMKYITDRYGFRPDIIRLNNQVDYSLFGKLHYAEAGLGSGYCLWDLNYINAYLGRDYIGYDSILKTMVKLKRLQDTLAHLGKAIILVHAPNKAYFYPEYFPQLMKGIPQGPTNLQACTRICDSLSINQVNFNSWFVALKKTYGTLLYPKQGIHWSVYGAALAADSLVRYMEKLRGITMPHLHNNKLVYSQTPQCTDDDLGKPLNLIFPFHKETYCYPQIGYPNIATATRPNVIYVGCSFMFQWLYLGIPHYTNNNWQFWYYFNEVCTEQFPHGDGNAPRIANYDWLSEVNKTDYIVLLYTAHNIPEGIGSGFIEKAYDHYYPGK
jgi:hypothetical protein